jgi:hypothetical protein
MERKIIVAGKRRPEEAIDLKKFTVALLRVAARKTNEATSTSEAVAGDDARDAA